MGNTNKMWGSAEQNMAVYMLWLSKEKNAVTSIKLPFVYHGLARYAVYVKTLQPKKGRNS